jgi:dihydrofolate reductase
VELGLIVATDRAGVIGKDGSLPWTKPADLQRFRRITEGSALVMGRRTWDSIGKPLKGRHILVVTHRPIESPPPGVESVASLEGALARASSLGVPRAWIAGGETIYRQALALPPTLLKTIDLTVVDMVVPLPIYDSTPVARFPGVPHDFLLTGEVVNEEDPTLTHKVYARKKPSIMSMPAVRLPTETTP